MNTPADLRRVFEDKIKRGIFKPIERFLHEDIREERMQEALGLTWRLYADHAERGEILDDALLVHACKLRAIDLNRYVAQCDGGQRRRDVFDLRNYIAGRVEVLRFGDFDAEDEIRGPDDDEAPSGFGLAEATSANPTRRILSAINLSAWLTELSAEDRRMLELRAAGFGLEEIAEKMGVSTSCVFANCRRLGHALAEHAGICVKPKARTSSRLKVKDTGRRQGPISETRPVRKARVPSASRSSTSRSRAVAVAA
jgi:DNA-directed RNA polymerase specialized sigma24 family protein